VSVVRHDVGDRANARPRGGPWSSRSIPSYPRGGLMNGSGTLRKNDRRVPPFTATYPIPSPETVRRKVEEDMAELLTGALSWQP
jgi:hypothetical protein